MTKNKSLKNLKKIISLESFPGILLLFATIIALIVANSPLEKIYQNILNLRFGLSAHEWVNDVLMAIFFLGVGLEVKKEMLVGNLSSIKNAAFPIVAAIGGMIIPACIYLAITFNTPFSHGFGIPMATDIAFALGVLILLGKRVPNELKIFLLTLAVADDLGAIIIIAFFYSKTIVIVNLLFAFLILVILIILNKLHVRYILVYLFFGIFLWYFIFNSGIHATISGVLLAFTIPLRNFKHMDSPLIRAECIISKLSSYIIMPMFAFFNAGVNFVDRHFEFGSLSFAIIFGLIFGKPIGIFVFTYISTKLHIANKPKVLNWNHIFAVGILAGIGFTMSIFIATLTFEGENLDIAKISVLLSSFLAALIGSLYFKTFVFKNNS